MRSPGPIRAAGLALASVVLLLVGTGAGVAAASPVPSGGAPATSPVPSGGVSATDACAGLIDTLDGIDGTDAADWTALAGAISAVAEDVRGKTVARADRGAAKALAKELDELAATFTAWAATPASVTDEAVVAAFDSLASADAFAASTSIGLFLSCPASTPVPPQDVEVSIGADGTIETGPVAIGPARLSITNGTGGELGIVVLELVPDGTIDGLVSALDAEDPAPDAVVVAQLGDLPAIAPGERAVLDVLIPSFDVAIIATDPDGAVRSGVLVEE